MSELGNHLWQSTLFAAAVMALCFALRRNSARVRYWLWFAATTKFLLPFSLLVWFGGQGQRPAASPMFSATRVEQISMSFAPMPALTVAPSATRSARATWWPRGIAAVWLSGTLLLAGRW